MADDDDVDDALQLEPLSEDALLRLLRRRFFSDRIYTYAGEALLAVNPGRALQLYSAALCRAHLVRPAHALPPHVYGVAAAAVRRVRDLRRPQTLVATGVSGAGKTEVVRLALQCALVGARSAAPLAAAGTALEAFGNAATALNHNASRFGSTVDVEIDFKGDVTGGRVAHYLLEKSRASRPPDGERNFHAFYQLLAGADNQTLSRLRLSRAASHYRVLRAAPRSPRSPRRAAPPAAPDDAAHFRHTAAALAALGIDRDARHDVFLALAFMLKLGQLEFEPAQDVGGGVHARVSDESAARDAALLAGVPLDDLLRALGAAPAGEAGADSSSASDDSRSSRSSGGARSAVEWAEGARDAGLDELYARLFAWLVARANRALRGAGGPTLALLDAYGLESLARNGLDRLLINYAAERVHEAVLRATLSARREEAAAEGLPAGGAAWARGGAGAALAAFAGGVRGAPPAEEAGHPAVRPAGRGRFAVRHFDGEVRYRVRDMRAPAGGGRLAALLARSRVSLLAALGAGGSGRAPAAQRQRALVAASERRLAAAGAGLCVVRCVRADAAGRAGVFDEDLVRHQLHTQRIVEMVSVRRAGWSDSWRAGELVARYGLLAPRGLLTGAGDADDARALLRYLSVPAAAVGSHGLVLVRTARAGWALERRRAARVLALVRGLQRAWRRYRARRSAARVLQRAWRARARPRPPPDTDAAAAACRLQRAARGWSRRRYVSAVLAALPALASPLAPRLPPAPHAALAPAAAQLAELHHRWRCLRYRLRYDGAARNRMREKVCASFLFRGRKAAYAAGVGEPFLGDYLGLRAHPAWRQRAGPDRLLVFSGPAHCLRRRGYRAAAVALSTGALLVLSPRSLAVRARVPADALRALVLGAGHDPLLAVLQDARAPDCLLSGGDDLILMVERSIELATKLFLVAQHAGGGAPLVAVSDSFHARVGGRTRRVTLHRAPAAPAAPAPPRLVRSGSRLDIIL